MTTKPPSPPPGADLDLPDPEPVLTRLPDPPHGPDIVDQLPDIARAHSILGYRYRDRPAALVIGDEHLCYYASSAAPGSSLHDCRVSFHLTTIPADEILAEVAYIIGEGGNPPDFILQVASASDSFCYYTYWRETYARFKVAECWRFDPTGGRFYEAVLSGERLTADGTYEPIPVRQRPDGIIRGHSAALQLELRFVEGQLCFWDPTTGEYLRDLPESEARADAAIARANAHAARANAAAAACRRAENRVKSKEAHAAFLTRARQQAEAAANAEAARANAAEARIQELEAQLAALRQSP